MDYQLDPTGLVAVGSGVALAVLGALVLTIRPLRMSAIAFSLFAVVWGAQVVASNMVFRLAPDHDLGFWVVLMVALFMVLHAPLLLFATLHPWPSSPAGKRRALWTGVVLGTGSVLLLFLLAAEPALFIGSIGGAGESRFEQGPWYLPVSYWSNPFAFVLALLIVAWKLFRAPGVGARDQLAIVCAALLAYVSYSGSVVLHYAFLPLEGWSLQGAFVLRGVVTLLALLSTAGVVGRIMVRKDHPWRDLILVAGTVPFSVGVAEVLFRLMGIEWVDTTSVWRLVTAGLFTYAIARHRLFDAEVRLRRATGVGVYASVLFGAGLAVWPLLDLGTGRPVLSVAVFVGLATVCFPLVRLTRQVMQRTHPVLDEPGFVRQRKLAVYLAALEEANALERTKDQRLLERLRHGLDIQPGEHEHLLRSLSLRESAPDRKEGSPRYQVVRELGRGGMGRAVLARDTVLRRDVVLKEPLSAPPGDTSVVKDYLREARVLARITHPNVVTIFEVIDGAQPALVLEHMDGGNLRHVLDAKGSMPLERAVAIVADALAGLERVHAEGIVHRDLKPSNILLDRQGTAKLGDFGVARAPRALSDDRTMGLPDLQPGSLAYMSPEQARGDPVDARSDLYSMAVVLYEALTGRLPYPLEGLREYEVRERIQRVPISVPASGIPGELEPWFRRALAKEPKRRFRTARKMRDALQEAVAEHAQSKTARRHAGK